MALYVEEVNQTYEQTALQHEEQLEAQLTTCLADRGGSSVRLSEEVSRLSQHEVFALGEGECAEHKAGEQQHGDDVVGTCFEIEVNDAEFVAEPVEQREQPW